MSVKDRISKMNSLIVVETEKAQEPEKPIMRSLSLDVSLRFKGSETKSKGSVSYLKSRSSDGSMRSPLKLPGMEMEKGGEFKVPCVRSLPTQNTHAKIQVGPFLKPVHQAFFNKIVCLEREACILIFGI